MSKELPTSPTVLQNFFDSDSEFRSVIDKSWHEGVDYSQVEAPIVAHDGESIQVGLFTSVDIIDVYSRADM